MNFKVNQLRIDLKSAVDEKQEMTSRCESLTERLYVDQVIMLNKPI